MASAPASTNPIATIAFRRFGLVNFRVFAEVPGGGSTVVDRLLSASVINRGKILVSISLAPGAELSLTVSASTLAEPESLTKGVPSARQNVSTSSGSKRLHAGQRFIFGGCLEFNP